MTIGRRGVLGLGAIGVGAFALDGCGGALPWANAAATSPAEVDRLLAELDAVVAQLKALEPDVEKFGMKRGGAYVAEGQAVCTRLLTALCTLGTLRDVPRDFWKEPRLEERLKRTLPQIHATLTTALGYLANVDDEEGARIDERLHDDPSLPMRILENVDDNAKHAHVPIEQRAFLRTAITQLASRMRFEGTKEVMTGLARKYHRAVGSRMSMFGMPGNSDGGDASDDDASDTSDAGAPTSDAGAGDTDAGTEAKPPESPPLRVRFETNSSPNDVHVATCALQPTVTLDGAERRVQLDWEEFRCPPPPGATDEQPPIHGTVHTEPGENGGHVVTVVIYPPPGTSDRQGLSSGAVHVAQRLQRALGAAAPPPRTRPPPAEARLGERGESCLTKADCESPLACSQSTCRAEDDETSSAKLMKTTKAIAKYGAYLSIPPICAIGALVLLTCLFMVIVAGVMYANGD